MIDSYITKIDKFAISHVSRETLSELEAYKNSIILKNQSINLISKSTEKSISKKSVVILRAMFSNALVVGIVLGFFIYICGISLAKSIQASFDMITAVALPAALFGMGGVLYQYRPAGDIEPIIMICTISLLIHPAIVWLTGSNLELTDAQLRSAVITAAMAPGINTYVFACLLYTSPSPRDSCASGMPASG